MKNLVRNLIYGVIIFLCLYASIRNCLAIYKDNIARTARRNHAISSAERIYTLKEKYHAPRPQ